MVSHWNSDLKRSWRTRNEHANSGKVMANFRKASKAEGAFVDTPGCSSGFQILSGCLVLPLNMLPRCSWCVPLKLAVLQISMVQKLYLECGFGVALIKALSGTYVFSKQLPKVGESCLGDNG